MSELENRYSSLYGTKTSKGQLQGGFFLLAAGGLLGLAALILFFIGLGQNNPALGVNNPYFDWVKPALTLAPLALAGILLGISVALPTKTMLRVFSFVGLALSALAALLFFLHYPTHFNVAAKGSKLQDYMALDLGVAVVGFVLMASSVVSSIVGYYLSKTTVVQGGSGAEDDDLYGPGYEVPDWVVERDIEYAMKRYGVSWGEGSMAKGDKSIVVNVADSMAGATIGGLGKARTVQFDSEQVDASVRQLSGVRPNKKGAIPGEWADDATRALVAFRKQKEANPKAFTPKRTFWQKVTGFFTGRNTQPSVAPRVRAPAAAPTSSNGVKGARSDGPSQGGRRGTTIVIDDEK